MSRDFNFIKDLLRPERVLTDPIYTSVPGHYKMRKFRNVKIDFALGIKPCEAGTERLPVLIVGNIRLLKLLRFEDVRAKLEPCVTSEVSYQLTAARFTRKILAFVILCANFILR